MSDVGAVLAPACEADRPSLEAYLAERSDTCMLLRSNLRAVGLGWHAPDGAMYEAQYMLARRAHALVGVVAHAWNGNVVVEADEQVGELAVAAVRNSGRRVDGLIGAFDQVARARAALGMAAATPRLDSDEILMALSLDQLAIPGSLGDGTTVGRRAVAGDRDRLVPWRAAYLVETGQHAPGPIAEARAASAIDHALAERRIWVAERDGAVVAMCAHNAVLPDAVQVGGVFTPAALRGRGHARAVVAASLLDARASGARRAILFTPRPDAVAAYRAIGFAAIGRYAIVMFA